MFSFGFYNSKDGDRKYNASHMGKIFDGIITWGVLAGKWIEIPDASTKDFYKFEVVPQATPDLTVILHRGKAWLANTWNILDAPITLSFDPVTQNNRKRTDVICLQVNASDKSDEEHDPSRTNSIVVVKGDAVLSNGDDDYPQLVQTMDSSGNVIKWQYPLAYVTIYGGNLNVGNYDFEKDKIKEGNIISAINYPKGTEENKYRLWTPMVTGAPMAENMTDYLPTDFKAEGESLFSETVSNWNTWFDDLRDTVVLDNDGSAALAALNEKLETLIVSGTEEPVVLQEGQVYFQIEG